MEVRIARYPMPPSDNELKVPVRRFKKGGGGKRVMSFMDSDAYTAFRSAVDIWYLQHRLRYADQLDQVTKWAKEGQCLYVIADFMLHESTIFTQKGIPQRSDVTNRVKALHDTFSKILGIDDRYFVDCRQRKVVIPSQYKPCVVLRIGPVTIERFSDE